MSVKISELAKKLNLEVKDLRKKVQEMHLGVSERANVFRDDLAIEIERRLTVGQKDVEKENDEKKVEPIVIEKKIDKPEVVLDIKEPIVEVEEVPVEEIQEEVPNIVPDDNGLPLIEIGEIVSVGELAGLMKLPVSSLIKELMKNGVLANINERIDFETAAIVAADLGYTVILSSKNDDNKEKQLSSLEKYDKQHYGVRPPVVVVMGHVDHGKTSILDKIREANVVSSESGGITQHVGAYQVVKNGRKITFLDTPGHQAFSTMRAHGAKLTDIAVLVVAADDGVRPQTIEAINHARAAHVPIIVALNKIDKPGINLDRVKKELSDFNLSPEEWGGTTVMIPTSAKTGEGIDQLLEMILLTADMNDMKAYLEGPAQGVVIEANLSRKVGPVATVLLTQGCLKIRDSVVVGITDGVVRAMIDYKGDKLTKAYPSDAVRIAGLNSVPEFGDNLFGVGSNKEAKEIVLERKRNTTSKTFRPKTVALNELGEVIKEGEVKELSVILKTDVQGSMEAIRSSLEGIKSDEVSVNILQYSVGAVNESDVMMASSSGGLILSFRVKIEPNALKLAKKMGVKILSYDVIYRLIDDVLAALEALLKPEIVKIKTGKGKVLKIFTHGKKYRIMGVSVTKGEVLKSGTMIVYRGDKKVAEVEIDNLKRGMESVDKVEENTECGIGITGSMNVMDGDTVEFWKTETVIKKLK